MKLSELCCCCHFMDSKDGLDVRTSGYYDSNSNSEAVMTQENPKWEMTVENYREILKVNKYVLVQFNDRR